MLGISCFQQVLPCLTTGVVTDSNSPDTPLMCADMPDFSERSSELELMDAPDLPVDEISATLDELAVINSVLGGYGPSVGGVRSLLPRGCRRVRILDVGTGGGDIPRRIARWAERRGIDATVVGIDLSEPTVEYSRRKSEGRTGLEFRCADVRDLRPGERFDIVHAALTLHHFDDESAVDVLRTMGSLARWGVVINDLHRHPVAYHSIRWLTRLLSRSRLIRSDAPLSVLRAFRRGELVRLVARAGLPPARITWRWAFRWQVIISKSGGTR